MRALALAAAAIALSTHAPALAGTISGTNHNDNLIGTDGDDFILGLRGNDWIEGGKGDDTLTGDANANDHERDTFVFRWGDGHDIITDFESTNQADGDRILIDSHHPGHAGGYSDVFGFFDIYDGASFTNFANTTLTFHSGDYNGDGVLDSRVEVSVDGVVGNIIDILGVSLDTLHSADFMGG